MVLLGTIVNGLAIMLGAILGAFMKNIDENIKATIMQAIGLSVLLLGITMGLKSNSFIIVIGSLVIGSFIGEKFDLEGKMNQLGKWLEAKVKAEKKGNVAKAFVMTTIIYVAGAMAILGAIDSGVRGDHSILYTKALLDGFSAIIFTSTLGIGVFFSAFSVFIYQGTIALFAKQIVEYVPAELMNVFIDEMTAVGGVMIMAIGLNILKVTNIRIANFLPALVIVFFFVSIPYYWQ